MAWNQPGNNGQDRDPWGSSNNNGGNSGGNNKGGRDQGPPDLDDIFRKLSKKLSGFGGGKGSNSNSGSTIRLLPLSLTNTLRVWPSTFSMV
ncbi:protease modulator HflK N-terminal domain-containing protein, partial [Serratia marcescens]|uniref:protease modulator HflK N-terminal domain-containing protein n=1 Tax=Serratia marcescens TaxID=615 RepID=UPI0024CB6635